MTLKDLNLAITSLPHKLQRYDTVGDYEEVEGVTFFRISQTTDRREMLLIMIHEVVEWALCQVKGISNDQIDKFDLNWKRENLPLGVVDYVMEPGDDPNAPYYKLHQITTGIERILAAEMGVDWPTYERHLEELTQ